MSDPRALLVAEGYDAMAGAWEEFTSGVSADPRRSWLGELVARTPAGGAVVELGCGNGHLLASLGCTGFELVGDEVVTIEEPDGPVAFQWILARR